MAKTILVILVVFCCSEGSAQNALIVLKRKHKSIQHFYKDSHISFQSRDGQWFTGIITTITPDSFYLTREMMRPSLIGTDTLHFSGLPFALKDVCALPTKKELVAYDRDQVKVILGHEKFVWIRNGVIFQVAGAGYVGLNVANNLISNDAPFGKNNLRGLGVGTAVFLLGVLLHQRFGPYIHIGKKYRLECIILKNTGNRTPQ